MDENKVLTIIEIFNDGDYSSSLVALYVSPLYIEVIEQRCYDLYNEWSEGPEESGEPFDEFFKTYLEEKLSEEFGVELLDFKYIEI